MPCRAARDRHPVRVAQRVHAREIDDNESRRPTRTTRRGTGPVATWRRARTVPLSAQAMPATETANVTFTSDNRVRNVIHHSDTDGFDPLHPKDKDGRPKTFTLPEQCETKKTVKPQPAEHDLPFPAQNPTRPTNFPAAERAPDAISPPGSGHPPLQGQRLLSAPGDPKDPRPRPRRQEGPHRTPPPDRRRRGRTREGRARSRLLHGHVQTARPHAPPGPAAGQTRRHAQGPRPRTPPHPDHVKNADTCRPVPRPPPPSPVPRPPSPVPAPNGRPRRSGEASAPLRNNVPHTLRGTSARHPTRQKVCRYGTGQRTEPRRGHPAATRAAAPTSLFPTNCDHNP
ncbi:hypothetical protein EDD90_10568 [Streptomyces sp. Ag109_O5-1]|nr:hypothetical protein EDD90_10568 [Streptomyces sp. Ag109_O5-1]